MSRIAYSHSAILRQTKRAGEMRRGGASNFDIALELGISQSTAEYRLLRYSVYFPDAEPLPSNPLGRPSVAINDDLVRAFVGHIQSGLPISGAMERMGITRHHADRLSREAKDAGLLPEHLTTQPALGKKAVRGKVSAQSVPVLDKVWTGARKLMAARLAGHVAPDFLAERLNRDLPGARVAARDVVQFLQRAQS